jgi:hypothetical protein
MQQVLAKQPLPHPLVEILVRCGDDAHVRFERRVAADAVVLAIRQHPQQPHLKVRRHIADLVQEQRAALGLLEAAAARSAPRERCARVQHWTQQVFRNRSGVDGDEHPRTLPVQSARDDSFRYLTRR